METAFTDLLNEKLQAAMILMKDNNLHLSIFILAIWTGLLTLTASISPPPKWLTLGVAQSPTAVRDTTKAIAGRSERVLMGARRGRSGRRGSSWWSYGHGGGEGWTVFVAVKARGS